MPGIPAALDAVVVGGGPAGSLCALRLSRAGYDVALIERRQRGLTKTCGQCLGPRGRAVLAEHGLLGAAVAGSVGVTRHVRIHDGPRVIAVEHAGRIDHAPGLVVDRGRFDQMLIDAAADAGVRVFQPASATVGDRCPRVSTVHVRSVDGQATLRTRLVVGADGIGSRVARAMGLAAADVGGKYGFSFGLPDCSGDVPDESICLFVIGGGYLGVVRRCDGVHVAGLVGAGEAAGHRDQHRHPLEFVRHVASHFRILQSLDLHRVTPDVLRGFTAAGPMPWRPRRVATAGGVLLGDAAGYVEPFTGEGMTWALESASLLSSRLVEAGSVCLDASGARVWERAYDRHIRRRQRLCHWLARGLERPRWRRLIFRVGAGHAGLARRIRDRVVAA